MHPDQRANALQNDDTSMKPTLSAIASIFNARLIALVAGFHLVFDVGLPSLAAFTLAAILTGHLLGGPDPSDRTSLAVACASRHIGLALLIAANARREQTLALVVAYLLTSALVSIPYIWLRTRGSATRGDQAPLATNGAGPATPAAATTPS